jgi:hypothetical protein
MAKKNSRRNKKKSATSSTARMPPRTSGGNDVSRSVYIPPRDFLQHHVAGVDQSIRRTLSWVAITSVNLVSATYTEATVVLLNSPFDPDTALGGASAQGFAKYMGFYSKCYALGARARVKYALSGASAIGISPTAVVTGMTITTNTASLTGVVNATQQGLCDYKLLNANPDSHELLLSVDFSKFVDKPDILDDPQWFCTSSANPAQLICLHVWAQDLGVATSNLLNFITEVEMDCVFTDPIPFT